MARALSNDLRSRVLQASSEGPSARQAAARFEVGISPAIRWIGRAKLGERSARAQGWRRGSCLGPHEAFVFGMIEAQKDITPDETVIRLDDDVGIRIGRRATTA
ncbi:Transposase [Hartmannibacter diazotrophicus]|uniref:Transposase n=1 Tax=Hartmannibacter diazotrophicus TaxID=1482074 RepID=A0A2C9DAD0_9HYPH|nr:Transposase [Hartmannibacter diazotrophicus]